MTTVYQIKYFCKAPGLILAAQLYKIHSRFQNISFKTITKMVALIYEILVLSNQHFHFYTVTFKNTDVVYAIRIGKRPAVFKALQHLSTRSNVRYNWISQAKLQNCGIYIGLRGRNFFCRPTDSEGSLWWKNSPFEIRFCSKEHLTRNTRYASYPIHPVGQLVRCQSDPYCCTCYCTQVNPLFAFMRGLVALILIHSPSNPPPSTGIHTLASANTRKNELRCVGKFYCRY